MKNNNKGFSYVELILVIAIIAIVVGLVSLSMGLVGRTNVNRGAEKLYSSLSQARSTSVTRGTERGMLTISCDGNKYYCYIGSLTNPNADELKEALVSSPVEIGYYYEGDDTLHKITAGTSLSIGYDKASGAFIAIGENPCCSQIVLINGDKTAAVKLHVATGKCELIY